MARVAFKAHAAGTQSVNETTNTDLVLATVDYDTHGFWISTTTATVPTGMAGLYRLAAGMQFAPRAAGGHRALAIAHYNSGGTLLSVGVQSEKPISDVNSNYLTCSRLVKAAAGDYFRAYCYHESAAAGALNVADSASNRLATWLAGSLVRAPVRVGWRRYRGSAQTIGTGATTAVALSSADFDTHAFATSDSRYTVPAGLAGLYRVSGSFQFSPSSAGTIRLLTVVHYNSGGTRLGFAGNSREEGLGSNSDMLMATYAGKAAAGDYFQLEALQDSGGNLDLTTGAPPMIAGERLHDMGRPRVGWRAHLTSTQTLADSASPALEFATVDYDTHAFQTATTRHTIPAGAAGIYRVEAGAVYDQSSGGTLRALSMQHYNSGGTLLGLGAMSRRPISAGSSVYCATSYEGKFAAGDYVEVYGFQNSGGNLDVEEPQGTWIAGDRVG